ncbi:hypothetical protein ABT336_22890 [Micromonospora sp. NPDC000207]|uniref:hypothetical protein n=1 Tax=Micromonospora sp. NPDC000207 TaxID=3154246 RepID=UPI00331A29E3
MNAGEDAGHHDTVSALKERLELGNVFFQSFSGESKKLGNLSEFAVELGTSHALVDDHLLYRFNVECKLLGGSTDSADGRPEYGSIQLRLVCEFTNAKGLSASTETIEEFGDSVALNVAHPYIREAISSIVVRLGFPALTIGMFSSPGAPRTVSGRRTPQ